MRNSLSRFRLLHRSYTCSIFYDVFAYNHRVFILQWGHNFRKLTPGTHGGKGSSPSLLDDPTLHVTLVWGRFSSHNLDNSQRCERHGAASYSAFIRFLPFFESVFACWLNQCHAFVQNNGQDLLRYQALVVLAVASTSKGVTVSVFVFKKKNYEKVARES